MGRFKFYSKDELRLAKSKVDGNSKWNENNLRSASCSVFNGKISGNGRGHRVHRTSWTRIGGDQRLRVFGRTAPRCP